MILAAPWNVGESIGDSLQALAFDRQKSADGPLGGDVHFLATAAPLRRRQGIRDIFLPFARPAVRASSFLKRHIAPAAAAAFGVAEINRFCDQAVPVSVVLPPAAASSARLNRSGNVFPRFSARARMPAHAFALK